MANDTDQVNEGESSRTAAHAHEIWEGEGRPHGRDREHW
jgi:hypothetical protein